MRKQSVVAPDWWDYTTLDDELVNDVARLTVDDMAQLSRPGFKVVMYDTIEDFYLAEALEYIEAWKQSTPDNPCGICGPIGPTEQLPLVARIVNAIGLDLGKLDAHFWGMDEWVEDGVAEVRGGGAKPWRQKGTGRARAGSSRSPIWVGGGTVFGPRPRSYRIDLPKKLKQSAYRSLFSLKAKQGGIKVVEDFSVEGKTKQVAEIGKALSVTKGILITDSEDNNLKRAIRNIPWFNYNNMKRISSREIFYSKEVVITESALNYLNEKYMKVKSNESE